MLLTDRLKSLGSQVKGIRESLTDVKNLNDPKSLEFERDGSRRIATREGAPNRQVMALANLMADVKEGRRPTWHLKEAMSTSDFPLLFGDVLYRQLLGGYTAYPTTYQNYFRLVDVLDFRSMSLYTLDGGQGLLDEVAELAPYPETKFTESKYALAVKKYGRRYGISFEMLIQDDLNAFNARPQLMAVGARRSEEYLATTMMCDVNGPHATFFSAGNKNLTTGALTIPNLQIALAKLGEMVDSEGLPIMADMIHLVTTVANEIPARNILNSTELHLSTASDGASATQTIIANNWMKSRFQLHINPFINYVASACATEPWFLIAGPALPSNRPAFMFGFLRGRRQPQLWVKDPDATLLGGGESSPSEGNFDNDSIDYKLRHIYGAAQGDPKSAVASFG